MNKRRKRILKRIILWADSQILQIAIITLIFLLIVSLFVLTKKDVLTLVDITVISTFLLTFFATLIFNKVIDLFRFHVEDEIKINYNFNDLKKLYTSDIDKQRYYKDAQGNVLPLQILYEHDGLKKVIIDDSQEMYVLPFIISANMNNILQAHRATTFSNNLMIRMDEVMDENNQLIISTSRTTYINTLLTNRACDYPIAENLTVRLLLEPGPYLNDLNVSKMSNHIGYNILIMTNDNKILFTKRAKNVSTAKNKVSFGISGSLKPKFALNDNNSLDIDGITNAVFTEIKHELAVDKKFVTFNFNNDLICIYRELFEGGKPHFFFKAKINMNSEELKHYFDNKKVDTNLEKDSDQLIVLNRKDFLNLNPLDKQILIKRKQFYLAHTTAAVIQYSIDRYDEIVR